VVMVELLIELPVAMNMEKDQHLLGGALSDCMPLIE
jgi:hypothetical protein